MQYVLVSFSACFSEHYDTFFKKKKKKKNKNKNKKMVFLKL